MQDLQAVDDVPFKTQNRLKFVIASLGEIKAINATAVVLLILNVVNTATSFIFCFVSCFDCFIEARIDDVRVRVSSLLNNDITGIISHLPSYSSLSNFTIEFEAERCRIVPVNCQCPKAPKTRCDSVSYELQK